MKFFATLKQIYKIIVRCQVITSVIQVLDIGICIYYLRCQTW